MKKYNIWNKIFHKRKLNKNVADYKLQQSLVNSYESKRYSIKEFGVKGFVMLTLIQINMECLRYINEVYIGGIYGLNTRTIARF
jgi:hypothetical protein